MEGPAFLVPVLLSIVFTGLVGYVFYRLGYLGAADVKALVCLALLFPVQPVFSIQAQGFPLLASPAVMPFPPALLMLGNGLALALAVPLGLFLYNLRRSGIRGMAGNGALSFVAYRADIDRLGGRRFVRLAHAYDEISGQVSRRFAPGGLDLSGDTLRNLRNVLPGRQDKRRRLGDPPAAVHGFHRHRLHRLLPAGDLTRI